MISITEGNLFNGKHQALAHGVNTKGIMNSGIVIQFRKEYPELFQAYENYCKTEKPKGGDIYYYNEIDKPPVYNLFTQEQLSNARADFLKTAMKNMYYHAKTNEITDIAMPAIGIGLGNLREEELIEAINPFITDSEVHATIYILSGPVFYNTMRHYTKTFLPFGSFKRN